MKTNQQGFINELNSLEERKIINVLLLADRPLTRREISNVTEMEISVLCRVLYHMVHSKKQLQISHYAKCKSTDRKVMHFSLAFSDNLMNYASK